MNILHMLVHDHESARDLAAILECQGGARDRSRGIDRLATLIATHSDAADRLLREAVEQDPSLRSLRRSIREQHRQLAHSINSLRTMIVTKRDWKCRVAQLRAELARHARRARSETYEAARQALGESRLESIYYEAERNRNHQSRKDSLIYPQRVLA